MTETLFKAKPRIGIFLANHPFQSHTLNAATLFARAGYEVDIFLYKTHNYVDYSQPGSEKGVYLHDLTPLGKRCPPVFNREPLACADEKEIKTKKKVSLFRRFIRLARFIYVPWFKFRDGYPVIPFNLTRRALRILGKGNYRCVIGVEKRGLIWASRVAARLDVPYLYHSLELFTSDFQQVFFKNSLSFRHILSCEAQAHRGALATIIQDEDRARVLFAENGVILTKHNALYVPVGTMGAVVRDHSDFISSRFGIPSTHCVIQYFGEISRARFCDDLAKVAQQFPSNWVLVMHGQQIPPDFGNTILKLDVKHKVVLSLDPVDDACLAKVVSAADIGLAFYSPRTLNEQLTAFSSEKVALYAQCGVPCVAFDYPGFRKLATEEGCGIVIKDLDELPAAIKTIMANYNSYRENAFRAFDKYYRYDVQFAKVIQCVDRL